MSHITTIKTQIKDMDALATACATLGLELVRERKRYRTYNGRTAECEAAIADASNPKAYEVGVVSDGDGNYTLGYDSWRGGYGMMERVGDGCAKLLREYSCAAARRKAAELGWHVHEQRNADGTIELTCTPPSSHESKYASQWS